MAYNENPFKNTHETTLSFHDRANMFKNRITILEKKGENAVIMCYLPRYSEQESFMGQIVEVVIGTYKGADEYVYVGLNQRSDVRIQNAQSVSKMRYVLRYGSKGFKQDESWVLISRTGLELPASEQGEQFRGLQTFEEQIIQKSEDLLSECVRGTDQDGEIVPFVRSDLDFLEQLVDSGYRYC